MNRLVSFAFRLWRSRDRRQQIAAAFARRLEAASFASRVMAASCGRRMMGSSSGRRAMAALAVTVLLSSSALAANISVSNEGADSGSCGAKTSPCRSISRAIDNAGAGDTVVVGPGRYGDLDGDGTLGEAGEEPVPAVCVSGTGMCMIVVDKQVAIVSQTGAFATVLDPGLNSPALVTIGLEATGAVLGGSGKGFTILSPPVSGGAAVTAAAPATSALVTGNVIHTRQGASGILLTGGNQAVNNRVLSSPQGIGILLFGDGIVASANSATGGQFGFAIQGNDNVLAGNVAHGNDYGLLIAGGTGTTVTKSSFTGNLFNGVIVDDALATGTFADCDISGNATHSVAANCGFDAGGSAVTATNTWWGAATGPGSDPADDACNEAMGATTPFATAPIKIKLKGIR